MKQIEYGWYLEIFLKCFFYKIYECDYNLFSDSDTIIINSINIFDKSKTIFNIIKTYHSPFFKTIKTSNVIFTFL